MAFPLAELVWAAYARDGGDEGGPVIRPGGRRAQGQEPVPLPNDAELVERVRDGDRTVFERMYVAHYPALRRLAVQLTSSSDAADDAIQDVFATLWLRRASWEVSTTIRAYLAGAVRRAIQHTGRHAGIVRRVAEMWSAADESPALGVAPVSPDERAEARDLAGMMRQAIESLPPRRRAAILLRWYEGMSTSEIAESLGVSDRVARKLLAAAEASLRVVFDRLI